MFLRNLMSECYTRINGNEKCIKGIVHFNMLALDYFHANASYYVK